MSKWKSLWSRRVHRHWFELSITGKFTLVFGAFLALIVLVALTSYIALTTARRQMEAAIVTSMEVQQLVLKMDSGLQHARLLEKNLFLRSPTIGFSSARETYARQNDEKITEVVVLSTRLQQLISEPDVSDALRESKVNLNFYLSAADRYAAAFDETVELEARLAADETGAQTRLGQTSELLRDTIQVAGDPTLMLLYHDLQSFEKDYLLTRQGSSMQSAFNVSVPLREAISRSPDLDGKQQAQALAYLDDYVSVAKEVLKLDVEIRSKLNEFDLQAESIDPISEELIALANAEVQRTRDQIASANQLATVLLIVTVLAAVVLASVVATVFNNSITRNVIKLTEVAGQLRDGNLEVQAQISSADELGQLADSFNAMAARINALVNDLEQQIARRTATNENLQREIAERKRMEEELRRYQEHLEELVKERTGELVRATHEAEEALAAAEAANQAKSVFLATMSHELRTPLNAILGFAQFLQRDSQTTPDQLEGLTMIEQSGKHLLSLINDILDLAKVEAGKLDLHPAEFNLPGMLAELSHMAQVRTSQQDLSLNVELDDLPTYVYGDEKRLREVLLNLLDNAGKYTQQGQVTLKINLLRYIPGVQGSGQTGAQLRFTVEDTGIGIPADALSSIFDPFQQAGTSVDRIGGTGLGLAICKNLVKLMGGSLQIKSKVDVGSTFWFELTLAVADEQPPVPPQKRGQIIGIAGAAPSILVVDDSQLNRRCLVRFLLSMGFEVIETADGAEGLDEAKAAPPNAIITDVVMPGMSGIELIRQIRSSSTLQGVPVIATSASVFAEDRQQSLAAGSDAFIAKPIAFDELLEQLQRLLNLEWIYEDSQAATASDDEASGRMVAPPADEVADLMMLTTQGDIGGLGERVERLAKIKDGRYQTFALKLHRLIRQFAINDIQAFLQDSAGLVAQAEEENEVS